MAKVKCSGLEQLAEQKNPDWESIVRIICSYANNGTYLSSQAIIGIIEKGLEKRAISLAQLRGMRHLFGSGICKQIEMQRARGAKEYRRVFDYLGEQAERLRYHPDSKTL